MNQEEKLPKDTPIAPEAHVGGYIETEEEYKARTRVEDDKPETWREQN